MPRGRLLRTKIKEAREVARATEQGKLEGRVKVDQKKDLIQLFRERLSKYLDTLTTRDIVFLMSYFGMVYWAYTIIAVGDAQVRNFQDFWNRLLGSVQRVWSGKSFFVPVEGLQQLDYSVLVRALAVAYVAMHIQVDDVTNAVTRLTALIGGFV